MSHSADDHDRDHKDDSSDSAEPIRYGMRTRKATTLSTSGLRSATTKNDIYYNCIQCGTLTNSSWHPESNHRHTICLDCTRAMEDKYEYVEQTPRKRLMRRSELKAEEEGLANDNNTGDMNDPHAPTYTPQRLRLRRNSNESDTDSMVVVNGTDDRGTTQQEEEGGATTVSKQPTVNKRDQKEEARKRVETMMGAGFMAKLKHIENAGTKVWRTLRQLLLLPETDNFTPEQVFQALIKAEHDAHTDHKADANKMWKAQLSGSAVEKAMAWIKNNDQGFLDYEPDTAAILAHGWSLDAAGFIVDPDSEYASNRPVIESATPDSHISASPDSRRESAKHSKTTQAAKYPIGDRQRLPSVAGLQTAPTDGEAGNTPPTIEPKAATFSSFSRATDDKTWNRVTVDANAIYNATPGYPGANHVQQLQTLQPEYSYQHHIAPQLVGPNILPPANSAAPVLETRKEHDVNGLDELKKLERLYQEGAIHLHAQARLVSSVSKTVKQAMRDKDRESVRNATLEKEVNELRATNQSLQKRNGDLEKDLQRDRKKLKRFRSRASMLLEDGDDDMGD